MTIKIGYRPCISCLSCLSTKCDPFAGEQPDIVILDVAMPEVSGIGLLEFIRQRETWNQLPVIILATKQEEDKIQQAIGMGADGYVLKPIMLDELENTMQTTIEKRKQP